MGDSDPIQCPVCSWTGDHADLTEFRGDSVCPVCHQTLIIE